MKKKSKICVSFIGSGRVATALASAFVSNGIRINQIYSLHSENALKLAKKTGAKTVRKIEEMEDADFIIIAVKDDRIAKVSKKIKTEKSIILHTSGTVSLKSLAHKNCGVFYPLQTITNGKTDFGSVPLLIEGSTKNTEKKINALAKKLSNRVHPVTSVKRLKIHLAAVLVSNFTNYLYHEAQQILHSQKIPFDILLPLISKVTGNLYHSLPANNQTGPAVRKDQKTIKKHLELLSDNKNLHTIYKNISKAIQKIHSVKQK
jgi:predicted short-subunit dehydrogenase-like oxidoreductase (DUF2520 family)